MDDSYGIFTTDGETVAGTLRDEYALNLAERLDESTASLYISTRNGVLLLGTAVNVQKKGRRPDTFIYLEKVEWVKELPPRIDLSFIHEFYGRVERRLSDIEYEVRDLASDDAFFDDRNKKVITRLSGSDAPDYSVGRLILGKEVVCVSDDLSKSVDFVVAVAEKLLSYISAGFTIVVAKRTFRDADLLVTEKYAGKVNIDLNTERTDDPKWGDIYRSVGVFAQNPVLRQKIPKDLSRKNLQETIVSMIRTGKKLPAAKSRRFGEFLDEENIGEFQSSEREFSSSAYETQTKAGFKTPKEGDYGKWKINDYDRENLMLEYEEHMEKKKKGRIHILAVLGILIILIAAVVIFFAASPGFLSPGQNTTEVPHITPSATIVPEDKFNVTRLNSAPGNVPNDFSGFGSAYEITIKEPGEVTIDLIPEFSPDLKYYLMRYNQTGYSWDLIETTLILSEHSATAVIPESGIYRLFTDRESGE